MNAIKLLTDTSCLPTLDELKHAYVLDVLSRSRSKAAAARTLGVNRRTIYRILGSKTRFRPQDNRQLQLPYEAG